MIANTLPQFAPDNDPDADTFNEIAKNKVYIYKGFYNRSVLNSVFNVHYRDASRTPGESLALEISNNWGDKDLAKKVANLNDEQVQSIFEDIEKLWKQEIKIEDCFNI